MNILGDLVGYVCFKSFRRGCLVVANKDSWDIPNAESYVCRTCAMYCGCDKVSNGSFRSIFAYIPHKYYQYALVSCAFYIVLI